MSPQLETLCLNIRAHYTYILHSDTPDAKPINMMYSSTSNASTIDCTNDEVRPHRIKQRETRKMTKEHQGIQTAAYGSTSSQLRVRHTSVNVYTTCSGR